MIKEAQISLCQNENHGDFLALHIISLVLRSVAGLGVSQYKENLEFKKQGAGG